MHSIRKKIPVIILTLIMAGVLSLSIASATLPALTPPPNDGYSVGDILDPGCAPTDIDCLINPISILGVL